jgi:hypothetical protein
MVFWDWFIFFFIVVPIAFLWFFVLVDIFARPDIGGGQKVLWILLIFIIPFLGALIYLAARPQQPEKPMPS